MSVLLEAALVTAAHMGPGAFLAGRALRSWWKDKKRRAKSSSRGAVPCYTPASCSRVEAEELRYEWDPKAFWLFPDWSGGHNLGDAGTEPFWCLPPKRPEPCTLAAPEPPPPEEEGQEVRAARTLLTGVGRAVCPEPGSVRVEPLGADVLISYYSTSSTTGAQCYYQSSRESLNQVLRQQARAEWLDANREVLEKGADCRTRGLIEEQARADADRLVLEFKARQRAMF